METKNVRPNTPYYGPVRPITAKKNAKRLPLRLATARQALARPNSFPAGETLAPAVSTPRPKALQRTNPVAGRFRQVHTAPAPAHRAIFSFGRKGPASLCALSSPAS